MTEVVTYGEADAMVSGSETEDLDVGLLVEARAGEISAIAAVCGHYRGRLMILAQNAGAAEPDVVVQNALTEALLRIEPVETPSLAVFERTLFDRVVADSHPVPPHPIHPAEPFDDRPLGAPVPGLAALAASGGRDPVETADATDPALLGSIPTAEIAVGVVDPIGIEPAAPPGGLLSQHTGPVDWAASLPAQELPSSPVLIAPSKRFMAGVTAAVCGIGLLATFALFAGGGESADEPQLAALVSPDGAQPPAAGGSASGPESAAPEEREQSRSSGVVTGSTGAIGPSTIVLQPDTTAAPSSTVATTVTTSPPPTTAQPTTTAAPTTQPETTTTQPESTTTSGPRPGDFSNQELDNRTFGRGDFRDHDFTNARLNNVDFRRADLRGVSFAGAVLTNVQFDNVDLTGASFQGADMDNTSFNRRSNISGVDFRNSKLTNGRIMSGFDFDNPPRSWPDGEFDFFDD